MSNNPKININKNCTVTTTPAKQPCPTKTTTRTPRVTRTLTKSLTPTRTSTTGLTRTPTNTITITSGLTRTPTATPKQTTTKTPTLTKTPTNTTTTTPGLTRTPTNTVTLTNTTSQTTTRTPALPSNIPIDRISNAIVTPELNKFTVEWITSSANTSIIGFKINIGYYLSNFRSQIVYQNLNVYDAIIGDPKLYNYCTNLILEKGPDNCWTYVIDGVSNQNRLYRIDIYPIMANGPDYNKRTTATVTQNFWDTHPSYQARISSISSDFDDQNNFKWDFTNSYSNYLVFAGLIVPGNFGFVDITRTPTTSITPTMTPTSGLTSTPTQTLKLTSTPTKTLTVTPTPEITPSSGATRTPTPTPEITPSREATRTPTPTNEATRTPTPTPEITPSNGATRTPTPSITTTKTVTPSITITQTPTNTITPSITVTQTPTSTITPTKTPTSTQTPTNTVTPTPTDAKNYLKVKNIDIVGGYRCAYIKWDAPDQTSFVDIIDNEQVPSSYGSTTVYKLSSYDVYYYDPDNLIFDPWTRSYWIKGASLSLTETDAGIANLSYGGRYIFRVDAIYSSVDYPSIVKKLYTNSIESYLNANENTPNSPNNVIINSVPGYVTLNWSEPIDDDIGTLKIKNYYLLVSDLFSNKWVVSKSIPITERSYVISHNSNGGTFRIEFGANYTDYGSSDNAYLMYSPVENIVLFPPPSPTPSITPSITPTPFAYDATLCRATSAVATRVLDAYGNRRMVINVTTNCTAGVFAYGPLSFIVELNRNNTGWVQYYEGSNAIWSPSDANLQFDWVLSLGETVVFRITIINPITRKKSLTTTSNPISY